MEKDVKSLSKKFNELFLKFLTMNISPIRKASLIILLKRINDKNTTMINLRHTKKLEHLYGGQIYLKEEINNVLNLSNVEISEDTLKILNLGMNTHLKEKYDQIKYKHEIEKLYQ